ncbi:DUF4331 family protein [Micromonospora sp. WMMD1102]|uniref:DUF4331 family protein n=1 Tax=Micromonospora sp. WMMD1102 TaxID=3016105 RepID=UPI0024151431|nr:DUF4331 family protein [Micromonospora sp. WMMD1102]MDG4788723.1 DUF4331 family protein [Micromonospora sp. WMMD1102]
MLTTTPHIPPAPHRRPQPTGSIKEQRLSHHLDSPLARQDPRLDISDVYVFPGDTGTVFVMNTNPLSGTGGFHPEGRYEFKIDTDGDAAPDITLRVTFGPPDAEGCQPVELRSLRGAAARDPHGNAPISVSGRTGEELKGPDGTRLWSGAAADPFFIEGTVVTEVVRAIAEGTPPDLSEFDPATATNLFAGTNVCSIVVEMPNDSLPGGTIGFWGVTALATDTGGWRQINRCAKPLLNTLFNPADSERADDYNAGQPSDDLEVNGPLIAERVARVVRAMGTTADPGAYGRQVRDALLPDVLRYDVGTPANFGFAGQNGRGLTEWVPEVMFAIVLNAAVPLGLRGNSAAAGPRPHFPYLAPPIPLT